MWLAAPGPSGPPGFCGKLPLTSFLLTTRSLCSAPRDLELLALCSCSVSSVTGRQQRLTRLISLFLLRSTFPTGLFASPCAQVRDDVYHSILNNDLPNLLEYGNISALTNLWYTGQITNFEYLTHLNKHAGRSFNDLMQYPVFPFILADYVSETLDLGDPSVYR